LNRVRLRPNAVLKPLLTLAVIFSGCTGTTSSTGGGSPPPVIAVSVVSSATTVQTGQPLSLTATVTNDSGNKGVNWTVAGAGCSGSACGTISPTSSASGTAVTYTAPPNAPSPATVTITATSIADGTRSAAATVTISGASAISVTLSATTASIAAGASQSFTATVANDPANKGVSWTLSGCTGAACGTLSAAISASGAPITYTAPATVPNPATVSLKATSVADGTKSATAAITITASNGPVSVALSPKRGGLTTSQSLHLTATVTNDVGAAGVTWSVIGGGSFTGQTATAATFIAPAAAGTVTVTATSKADITRSASTTIGVTDLPGVFTYHNDNARDGANTKEYALTGPSGSTQSNVSSSSFGKLFSCVVDGAVYAQPLWIANVTFGNAKHNVVVVATAHNSLYAFDADASPCVTLWHTNLTDVAHGGNAGETAVPSDQNSSFVGNGGGDITPETGVIGTPVIDPVTNIIYVVSKSVIQSSSTIFQRLHAIALATGAEALANPATISGATVTYPGSGDGGSTVSFNPSVQLQRAGLALVNGVVYICWASHEDAGHYYGWVAGYKASDLSLASTFNTTSSSGFGGIWMSGGAPAADSNNNLYLITGNGNFDGTTDFGDSFLKLSTSSGLKKTDSFTPAEQDTLNSGDRDLGAGGAALLVNLPSQKQIVIGGGKGATFAGQLYVLDSGALGGYKQGVGASDKVLQEFSFNHAIFATGAFWQNTLYIAGVNGPAMAFAVNPSAGTLNTNPTSTSSANFGFPGATPSVSASGTSNGIVWAIDTSNYCTPQSNGCGPAVLRALDATNLRTELWNSGNSAGNAVKFTVPTVANGKVYIGTRGNSVNNGGVGELDVFGLLPN
jgi:hypothetical protein